MSFDNTHESLGRTQKWKDSDQKADKNGACQTVYWVRQKKDLDSIGLPKKGKTWQTGATYQGEWQKNKKHGYGIQVWPNGNKYEGDWAYGQRHGHGVFWHKKGKKMRKTYAGNWSRGLKEGLGVFYYKEGGRYEGNWKDGHRQGRGTLFYANGDVYVGDWSDGKQSGFGTLTKANEDVYEGEWLNGKREGPGIYYYKSKEKMYDGEWVNDVPKCGVYTDAAEFFEEQELNPDPLEVPRLRPKRKQRPLPELGLVDPEAILAEKIEKIQGERQAVRNLPFVQLENLFSEEGLDDLRRIFSASDVNGTGKISPIQLKDLFVEVGFAVKDEDVAQLMVDLDKKAESFVNFPEFVKAAHLLGAKARQQEQAENQQRYAHGGEGEDAGLYDNDTHTDAFL